ncbi:4Fe-4S dicluster domain-containing protein [Selenomonas caprae]|uniref:4Fe-4S dicluster domain-containing protein n=1 Tax=Selenomonas caprae TaxID=2606905 RepID=A0A5D6WS13_9FIRM|nr:4Fe-4S binding protein [Selenomonas caprae]TYZ29758.1 4Fe-4S dicluster domain-containing protein [Selenomonas caprae]
MSINKKNDYQWIKIDPGKCVHCGICVNYCPRDVLAKDDNGVPYMKHRDDCWYCDVCSFVCPKNALVLKEVPYLIK